MTKTEIRRQDQWAEKMRAAGNCIRCGKPRTTNKNFCPRCNEKLNADRKLKRKRSQLLTLLKEFESLDKPKKKTTPRKKRA